MKTRPGRSSAPAQRLLLAIEQTAPLRGKLEGNLGEVLERAAEHPEESLVVFPELVLTGYTLRSGFSRLALEPEAPALRELGRVSATLALGFAERGADELIYNSALLLQKGTPLCKHRKIYLPTYGPFEEGRFFAPGKDVPPVATLPNGWRVGLLICEDFWHPGLVYLLAVQGADLILVLAAAPGRDPGGEEELRFASQETWELLARAAAIQFGTFVVLANRAGSEEGLTFAGGSLVVGPDGVVRARAPQGRPATLTLPLSRSDLRAARKRFSHLRDEDPGFQLRALESLLR